MNNPSFVTSKDGTRIAYYSKGCGPSVIVVSGALAFAQDYDEFVQNLAEKFTVHTIERRGRGDSGPQGNDYGIHKECEDVIALQGKTGSQYIVGHSYGGLIALESARNNKLFKKLAVYEPGVSIDNSIPIDWAEAYTRNLQQNKPLEAFIVFIKAMNPSARKNPNWLLKVMLPRIVGKEKLKKIISLLKVNLREHQEVARLNNSFPNYKQVDAKTLLMYGGKSQKNTKETIERLSETIPNSAVKEFSTLDHFGIDEKAPAEVAKVVQGFFLENSND